MSKEITRQDKINKIYEIIADKSPTFGCKILKGTNDCLYRLFINETDTIGGYYNMIEDLSYTDDIQKFGDAETFNIEDGDTIYGHPVMIGDVLNYMYMNNIPFHYIDGIVCPEYGELRYSNEDYILSIWECKKLPIESQNDECIDFVIKIITGQNL